VKRGRRVEVGAEVEVEAEGVAGVLVSSQIRQLKTEGVGEREERVLKELRIAARGVRIAEVAVEIVVRRRSERCA